MFLLFFFSNKKSAYDIKRCVDFSCVLSRSVLELADRRIYPAVDIAASGTRREELLADPATVEAKQKLRRGLVGLPPEKAVDVLLAQLRRTKTNQELLAPAP